MNSYYISWYIFLNLINFKLLNLYFICVAQMPFVLIGLRPLTSASAVI